MLHVKERFSIQMKVNIVIGEQIMFWDIDEICLLRLRTAVLFFLKSHHFYFL